MRIARLLKPLLGPKAQLKFYSESTGEAEST
jgi:hypothetical protein